MALLHFDGFDLDDWAGRYSITGASAIAGSTSTRLSAGRSLSIGSNTAIITALTAASGVFAGVAVAHSTSFTAPCLGFYGDAGVTLHMNVQWTNSSTMSLRRGTTVVATAAVPEPILGVTSWVYVEMWQTVHASTGRCVVKVDGATVFDFTGNTKNGGTATTIDRVVMGAITGGTSSTTYLDDAYVCDDTGSAPHNTFLGPVRVHTLSPSGAGTDTNMTPSSGANYACVDEQPYSATDYVTGSTAQRDTYAITDLPASPGTILAVQPVAIAKKTDAGALSLKTSVRSGGSVYSGTATALGTVDSTVRTIRTTDPATSSAWTASGVNAMEAGAEVV